jgi:hypothetical protein
MRPDPHCAVFTKPLPTTTWFVWARTRQSVPRVPAAGPQGDGVTGAIALMSSD